MTKLRLIIVIVVGFAFCCFLVYSTVFTAGNPWSSQPSIPHPDMDVISVYPGPAVRVLVDDHTTDKRVLEYEVDASQLDMLSYYSKYLKDAGWPQSHRRSNKLSVLDTRYPEVYYEGRKVDRAMIFVEVDITVTNVGNNTVHMLIKGYLCGIGDCLLDLN